jgi:hypothetical protein
MQHAQIVTVQPFEVKQGTPIPAEKGFEKRVCPGDTRRGSETPPYKGYASLKNLYDFTWGIPGTRSEIKNQISVMSPKFMFPEFLNGHIIT